MIKYDDEDDDIFDKTCRLAISRARTRLHKFIVSHETTVRGIHSTKSRRKVIFIHMDYLVRNWKFNNILLINVGSGHTYYSKQTKNGTAVGTTFTLQAKSKPNSPVADTSRTPSFLYHPSVGFPSSDR